MGLFKEKSTPKIESISLQRAVDKMEDYKVDTLYVYGTRNCPCCGKYEKKVFSFYGWDKKYPPLPEVFYKGKCPECGKVVGVSFKLL